VRLRYILMASVFAPITLGAIPAQAQQTLSKEQVQNIVKEYLLENPEIIIESLEAYRTNQERSMQATAAENIKKHLATLTSKDAPSVGKADASVTIVEFFDYNCGYCRRALEDIQKFVDANEDVRFVFQEMPILSPASEDMAKWSLAAHKQGKYFEFHSALMHSRGAKNAEGYKKIGQDLGLDVKKLEKDATSSAVERQLQTSVQIARDIGVRGTPAFIIDGQLYPGYLGEQGLRQAIEDARKNSNKEG
jgi:protein-disulfide isomerase